jgi:GGDEF domain-containing protein
VDRALIAFEVAQRIHGSLSDPVNVAPDVIALRASVGVAWSAELIDVDVLVAQADQAMYESKRTGSSAVVLFGQYPSARR